MRTNNKQPIINNNIRYLEIFAVILTGLGKFLFMDVLNWRFAYIFTACLFWISYVIYRYRKNNNILTYWGLTKKGFKSTFLELLPLALLCIAIFIIVGNKMGTNVLHWRIIPILLLYPIWGVIQQFIIVGLLARNLKDMEQVNIPEVGIVFLTATVFAIVHYPSLILVGTTFLLAIVYTLLYLRGRNLLVLGLYHGWLGALFFYTVLGRDAWLEVFEKMGI